MKRFLVLALLLASFASAQDCAALLDSLQPQVELETLEQRITTTVATAEGSSEVAIYQLLDRPGERIYQEMTLPGMGEVVLRYLNGAATMEVSGAGMQLPVPPALAEQLEATLDGAFAQQGFVPTDYEVISCDGMQSYGSLIEGEQVTVSAALPEAAGGDTELRFLFGPDDTLVGSYLDVPPMGPSLMVFDTYELDASGVPLNVSFTMYQLDGDTPTIFSKTNVATLSYNEPVNETLFTP